MLWRGRRLGVAPDSDFFKKVKIPEVLLYYIFSWGWGSRFLLELILELKPPNQVLHTDTGIVSF